MVLRHFFHTIVTKLLDYFFIDLSQIKIKWISWGSVYIEDLTFQHITLNQLFDLHSLYIKQLTISIFENIFSEKNDICHIKVDTIYGIIIPSSTISSNNLTKKRVSCPVKQEKNIESVQCTRFYNKNDLKRLETNRLYTPTVFNTGQSHNIQSFILVVTYCLKRVWKNIRSMISFMGTITLCPKNKYSFMSQKIIHFFYPDNKQHRQQTSVPVESIFKPEPPLLLIQWLLYLIGHSNIMMTNLHIRYEDSVFSPNHPFQLGCILTEWSIQGKTTDLNEHSGNQDQEIKENNFNFVTTCNFIEYKFFKHSIVSTMSIVNCLLYHKTDHHTLITRTDYPCTHPMYQHDFSQYSTHLNQKMYIMKPITVDCQLYIKPILQNPLHCTNKNHLNKRGSHKFITNLSIHSNHLSFHMGQEQIRDLLLWWACVSYLSDSKSIVSHSILNSKNKPTSVSNVKNKEVFTDVSLFEKIGTLFYNSLLIDLTQCTSRCILNMSCQKISCRMSRKNPFDNPICPLSFLLIKKYSDQNDITVFSFVIEGMFILIKWKQFNPNKTRLSQHTYLKKKNGPSHLTFPYNVLDHPVSLLVIECFHIKLKKATSHNDSLGLFLSCLPLEAQKKNTTLTIDSVFYSSPETLNSQSPYQDALQLEEKVLMEINHIPQSCHPCIDQAILLKKDNLTVKSVNFGKTNEFLSCNHMEQVTNSINHSSMMSWCFECDGQQQLHTDKLKIHDKYHKCPNSIHCTSRIGSMIIFLRDLEELTNEIQYLQNICLSGDLSVGILFLNYWLSTNTQKHSVSHDSLLNQDVIVHQEISFIQNMFCNPLNTFDLFFDTFSFILFNENITTSLSHPCHIQSMGTCFSFNYAIIYIHSLSTPITQPMMHRQLGTYFDGIQMSCCSIDKSYKSVSDCQLHDLLWKRFLEPVMLYIHCIVTVSDSTHNQLLTEGMISIKLSSIGLHFSQELFDGIDFVYKLLNNFSTRGSFNCETHQRQYKTVLLYLLGCNLHSEFVQTVWQITISQLTMENYFDTNTQQLENSFFFDSNIDLQDERPEYFDLGHYNISEVHQDTQEIIDDCFYDVNEIYSIIENDLFYCFLKEMLLCHESKKINEFQMEYNSDEQFNHCLARKQICLNNVSSFFSKDQLGMFQRIQRRIGHYCQVFLNMNCDQMNPFYLNIYCSQCVICIAPLRINTLSCWGFLTQSFHLDYGILLQFHALRFGGSINPSSTLFHLQHSVFEQSTINHSDDSSQLHHSKKDTCQLIVYISSFSLHMTRPLAIDTAFEKPQQSPINRLNYNQLTVTKNHHVYDGNTTDSQLLFLNQLYHTPLHFERLCSFYKTNTELYQTHIIYKYPHNMIPCIIFDPGDSQGLCHPCWYNASLVKRDPLEISSIISDPNNLNQTIDQENSLNHATSISVIGVLFYSIFLNIYDLNPCVTEMNQYQNIHYLIKSFCMIIQQSQALTHILEPISKSSCVYLYCGFKQHYLPDVMKSSLLINHMLTRVSSNHLSLGKITIFLKPDIILTMFQGIANIMSSNSDESPTLTSQHPPINIHPLNSVSIGTDLFIECIQYKGYQSNNIGFITSEYEGTCRIKKKRTTHTLLSDKLLNYVPEDFIYPFFIYTMHQLRSLCYIKCQQNVKNTECFESRVNHLNGKFFDTTNVFSHSDQTNPLTQQCMAPLNTIKQCQYNQEYDYVWDIDHIMFELAIQSCSLTHCIPTTLCYETLSTNPSSQFTQHSSLSMLLSQQKDSNVEEHNNGVFFCCRSVPKQTSYTLWLSQTDIEQRIPLDHSTNVLTDFLSFASSIMSLYIGLRLGDLQTSIHWDFLLLLGHWILNLCEHCQDTLQSKKIINTTTSNKNLHQSRASSSTSFNSWIQPFFDYLVVDCLFHSLSIALSTNTTDFLTLCIENISMTYPNSPSIRLKKQNLSSPIVITDTMVSLPQDLIPSLFLYSIPDSLMSRSTHVTSSSPKTSLHKLCASLHRLLIEISSNPLLDTDRSVNPTALNPIRIFYLNNLFIHIMYDNLYQQCDTPNISNTYKNTNACIPLIDISFGTDYYLIDSPLINESDTETCLGQSVQPGACLIVSPDRLTKLVTFVLDGFETMSIFTDQSRYKYQQTSRRHQFNSHFFSQIVMHHSLPSSQIQLNGTSCVLHLMSSNHKVGNYETVQNTLLQDTLPTCLSMDYNCCLLKQLQIHTIFQQYAVSHCCINFTEIRLFNLVNMLTTQDIQPMFIQFVSFSKTAEPSPEALFLIQPLLLTHCTHNRGNLIDTVTHTTQQRVPQIKLDPCQTDYNSSIHSKTFPYCHYLSGDQNIELSHDAYDTELSRNGVVSGSIQFSSRVTELKKNILHLNMLLPKLQCILFPDLFSNIIRMGLTFYTELLIYRHALQRMQDLLLLGQPLDDPVIINQTLKTTINQFPLLTIHSSNHNKQTKISNVYELDSYNDRAYVDCHEIIKSANELCFSQRLNQNDHNEDTVQTVSPTDKDKVQQLLHDANNNPPALSQTICLEEMMPITFQCQFNMGPIEAWVMSKYHLCETGHLFNGLHQAECDLSSVTHNSNEDSNSVCQLDQVNLQTESLLLSVSISFKFYSDDLTTDFMKLFYKNNFEKLEPSSIHAIYKTFLNKTKLPDIECHFNIKQSNVFSGTLNLPCVQSLLHHTQQCIHQRLVGPNRILFQDTDVLLYNVIVFPDAHVLTSSILSLIKTPVEFVQHPILQPIIDEKRHLIESNCQFRSMYGYHYKAIQQYYIQYQSIHHPLQIDHEIEQIDHTLLETEFVSPIILYTFLDGSMKPLLEYPIDVSLICSMMSSRLEHNNQTPNIICDISFSKLFIQLALSDMCFINTCLDDVFKSCNHSITCFTHIMSKTLCDPGFKSSSKDNIIDSISTTDVISPVQQNHIINIQETKKTIISSSMSNQVIDTHVPYDFFCLARYCFVWRICIKMNQTRMSLISLPYLTPLSFIFFESISIQLQQPSITSHCIECLFDCLDIIICFLKNKMNGDFTNLQISHHFYQQTTQQQVSNSNYPTSCYYYTDPLNGNHLIVGLEQLTDPFSIHIQCLFSDTQQLIPIKLTIYPLLRFMIAPSFCDGIQLLLQELKSYIMFPFDYNTQLFSNINTSLHIQCRPLIFSPNYFGALLTRSMSMASWIGCSSSKHPVVIQPFHTSTIIHEADPLHKSNEIGGWGTIPITRLLSSSIHSVIPLKNDKKNDFYPLTFGSQISSSSLQHPFFHSLQSCCMTYSNNTKHTISNHLTHSINNLNNVSSVSLQQIETTPLIIQDLRQIPYFLNVTERQRSQWIRNQTCYQIVYRVETTYEKNHLFSGLIEQEDEVLLSIGLSVSSIYIEVPDFPQANCYVSFPELILQSRELDPMTQLTITHSGDSGREMITLGCPLRIRSELHCSVDVSFRSTSNKLSEWKCHVIPNRMIHIPFVTSMHSSELMISKPVELEVFSTELCCFRSLHSRCVILTATSHLKNIFIFGLRDVFNQINGSTELILFEVMSVYNGLPRPISISIHQDVHDSYSNEMKPFTSEYITMCHFQFPFSLQCRFPFVSSPWGPPEWISLPFTTRYELSKCIINLNPDRPQGTQHDDSINTNTIDSNNSTYLVPETFDEKNASSTPYTDQSSFNNYTKTKSKTVDSTTLPQQSSTCHPALKKPNYHQTYHLFNRPIQCFTENGTCITFQLECLYDNFQFKMNLNSLYWILNLSSLSFMYVPLSPSVNSLAMSDVMHDPIELLPCDSFLNFSNLNHTQQNQPITSGLSRINQLSPLTNLNLINLPYSSILDFIILNYSSLGNAIQHRDDLSPHLYSQIHDGFYIESTRYGCSQKTQFYEWSLDNTDYTSYDIQVIKNQEEKTVIFNKGGTILQKILLIRHQMCFTKIILFLPSQIVVNHCPFPLQLQQVSSNTQRPIQLQSKQFQSLIWDNIKDSQNFRIAHDQIKVQDDELWSTVLDGTTNIDTLINIYKKDTNDTTNDYNVNVNNVDSCFLTFHAVYLLTLYMGKIQIIHLQAPFYTHQNNIHECHLDNVSQRYKIYHDTDSHLTNKLLQYPRPPIVIRNELLIPLLITHPKHKQFKIMIPPLTEVPYGVHSLNADDDAAGIISFSTETSYSIRFKHPTELFPLHPPDDQMFETFSQLTTPDNSRFPTYIISRLHSNRYQTPELFKFIDLELKTDVTSLPITLYLHLFQLKLNKILSETDFGTSLSQDGSHILWDTVDKHCWMKYMCTVSTCTLNSTLIVVCQGTYKITPLAPFNRSVTEFSLKANLNSMHHVLLHQTACHQYIKKNENETICNLSGASSTTEQSRYLKINQSFNMSFPFSSSSFPFYLLKTDNLFTTFIQLVLEDDKILALPLSETIFYYTRPAQKDIQLFLHESLPHMSFSWTYWIKKIHFTFLISKLIISCVPSIQSYQQTRIELKERKINVPDTLLQDMCEFNNQSSVYDDSRTTESDVLSILDSAPLDVILTQLTFYTYSISYPLLKEFDHSTNERSSSLTEDVQRFGLTVLSIDIIGQNNPHTTQSKELSTLLQSFKKSINESYLYHHVCQNTMPHILKPSTGLRHDCQLSSHEQYNTMTKFTPPQLTRLLFIQPQLSSSLLHCPKLLPVILNKTKDDDPTPTTSCHQTFQHINMPSTLHQYVFELFLDYQLPYSNHIYGSSVHIHHSLLKSKVNSKQSCFHYTQKQFYQTRWIDIGDHIIESYLPIPLTLLSSHWNYVYIINHLKLMMTPLTIQLDISWADQCLKPLYYQFQTQFDKLHQVLMQQNKKHQSSYYYLSTHCAPYLTKDKIQCVFPPIPFPSSIPIQFFIKKLYIQDIHITVSIVRLMTVLTFHEAEFLLSAVHYDDPKLVTMTDIHHHVRHHIMTQLLRQWYQLLLSFDIVGRPLTRMRQFWNFLSLQ